ncbi:MAG: MBL fold metallo-hydrolase [Chitinophagaceae bacterium]|nr:MBL fold metallo-hydrolase [Chitinophagaceae bacterium]
MSLFIASLNSGSNGNCYYIGTGEEAILVDAGISCRETEKRMKRLGLPMSNVKAVFISHEHGDHIAGIEVLARKHSLPVYITTRTRPHVKLNTALHSFESHVPVQLGKLSITAFPKYHDAVDPYSFVVECDSVRVGVFTDIGIACEQVIRYFKQCHAVFLEANYDEEMLDKGGYPYHLKKRIRGGEGHLSNTQALELFKTHRPPFMTHLVLSHLSRNNNDPALVQSLFDQHAGNTTIVVASRYKETAVYAVSDKGAVNMPVAIPVSLMKKRPVKDQRSQLSLFG